MKHLISWTRIGLAALLVASPAWAQSSGTVNQAFQAARQAVGPELQTKVVSVYGVGTPEAIQKWYIIFYDGTVSSHGRAVLVENNQITKTYAANGGATYTANLTFDPARLSSEGPALSAAQGYAAKHNISYDTVHALLKQTSLEKPFRWRIELLNGGKSRGYVFVNAVDATVASFAPPGAGPSSTTTTTTTTSSTTSTTTSADREAKGLAHDVKHTFLGIGGDLEEFFTGERTVDR